jgi:hypothetical protein
MRFESPDRPTKTSIRGLCVAVSIEIVAPSHYSHFSILQAQLHMNWLP